VKKTGDPEKPGVGDYVVTYIRTLTLCYGKDLKIILIELATHDVKKYRLEKPRNHTLKLRSKAIGIITASKAVVGVFTNNL
jgi:hypothetical protein